METMDWSKAKNILIVAFIITNIFLIYNIEKDLFNDDSIALLKEKNIEDVVEILKEKNIRVEAEVPRKILQMPVLNVEYETYDNEQIKDMLLEDGQFSTENPKILTYQNHNNKVTLPNIDTKKAMGEGEKFIREHGFMGTDVIYSGTKYDEGKYEVLFKQRYKGEFLEFSYMKCWVTPYGVEKFERMWLKPMDFGDNKKEIIPSTKALLKFMKDMDESLEEIVIKDISLGYWFDPSQISLTNWENIKSGTAFPAWRITLADGEARFIVAYENY